MTEVDVDEDRLELGSFMVVKELLIDELYETTELDVDELVDRGSAEFEIGEDVCNEPLADAVPAALVVTDIKLDVDDRLELIFNVVTVVVKAM